MDWDEVKELAPLYAIGALDEETARAVEMSLRNATPEQQRDIAEWRDVAALLPQALPQQPPPDYLKKNLLDRVTDEPQETIAEIAIAESAAAQSEQKVLPFAPSRRVRLQIPRWSLAAATILMTFTCSYLLWQNINLNLKNSAMAGELNALKQEVDGIVSPTTKVIAMTGDEAPQANAKVIWDTKTQQWVIYIFDLPAPPTDKDYQLWYVTKDSRISAAVFRPDAQGRTVLKLALPAQALTGLAATAVTLEPKGGSAQPTSKFYLKAQI
ncbi:MAG: anti-sigma factor [Blastocatellales bacterium]